MIRAVLDTNTLVSAVINTDSSVAQEIYQNAKKKRFLLTISPPILTEVDKVLHRPKVIKAHKRSLQELKEAIKGIADVSLIVPGKTEIEVVRDPDDDKIIVAAVEGNADYIVSRDKDLLDLKEYQGMNKFFPSKIKIITPEKFMGILRAEN